MYGFEDGFGFEERILRWSWVDFEFKWVKFEMDWESEFFWCCGVDLCKEKLWCFEMWRLWEFGLLLLVFFSEELFMFFGLL